MQCRWVSRIQELQKRIGPPWWRRNQRECQFQLSFVQDQQLRSQDEDDLCFSQSCCVKRVIAIATDETEHKLTLSESAQRARTAKARKNARLGEGVSCGGEACKTKTTEYVDFGWQRDRDDGKGIGTILTQLPKRQDSPGQSGGTKRPRSRTVSFAADRLPTWFTNNSGSLVQIVLSKTTPTCSLSVYEMMIFRNSILSGTEFCPWRKSHDDIFGRIVQIMNTSVWKTQDRAGIVWPGDSSEWS